MNKGITFEQRNFVLTAKTNSPIIITVPHDGIIPKQYLTGIFEKRISDPNRDIRITRDKYVFPIVKDILLRTPVNVVYAMLSRTYIDFNRPADIGVKDENLRRVYKHYHATISKLVSQCKKRFGYCVLLDFHGCTNLTKPGMENTDLIFGTNNRRSVFSNVDIQLEEWMVNRRYVVLVANEEMFQGIFTGRYNVIDYAEKFHVDSILIEVTRRYRVQGAESIGKKLANDLAEFIRDYTNK